MSNGINASMKVAGKVSGAPSVLELIIADLLKNGTYIASAVIGLGFLLKGIHWNHPTLTSQNVVRIGIGLFILLPILRVSLMLVMFVRMRDRHFVAIASVVLLIILASFVFGMVMPKVLPG